MEYPYPIQKLKGKLEGQFVIAFGRIIKTKSTTNKVYLELLNDFHIVKLNEDEVAYLFKDSVKQAFVPPTKISEKPVQKELASINTYYDVANK